MHDCGNPSRIRHNPSRPCDELEGVCNVCREKTPKNGESVTNPSRSAVTDFSGRKSLYNKYIYLSFIYTSRSHAHARALRVRTCERVRDEFLGRNPIAHLLFATSRSSSQRSCKKTKTLCRWGRNLQRVECEQSPRLSYTSRGNRFQAVAVDPGEIFPVAYAYPIANGLATAHTYAIKAIAWPFAAQLARRNTCERGANVRIPPVSRYLAKIPTRIGPWEQARAVTQFVFVVRVEKQPHSERKDHVGF
jgi:hypothetical protein